MKFFFFQHKKKTFFDSSSSCSWKGNLNLIAAEEMVIDMRWKFNKALNRWHSERKKKRNFNLVACWHINLLMVFLSWLFYVMIMEMKMFFSSFWDELSFFDKLFFLLSLLGFGCNAWTADICLRSLGHLKCLFCEWKEESLEKLWG